MIICGKRANENVVEFKIRSTMEKTEKMAEDAISYVINEIKLNK